ncbi:hypothetical protein GCM10023169_19520 [Georgenia halophila]|uniref:DUF3046 domain-containing protein n=1 Tax=Georgenia halophila TaxID=620889 RepID=A0ABP8L893_9MICO
MKHSEFWQVLDETFGPGYGRSVAEDLVLPGAGGRTAAAALAEGVPPRQVWDAVCDEMQLDESTRWLHRIDPDDPVRRSRR